MNAIFCALLLAGLIHATATGQTDAAQRALLAGGGETIELLVGMAGAYAFFGGILSVLRESGATGALAAAMRRPVNALFRFRLGEERALDDICVNLSANMLGMGAAATPAGLSAMRTLAQAGERDGRATDAMILFLVINTSSVQLLPASMIALRAQAGAANPADIVLPTLLATAVSTLTGVVLCRLCASRTPGKGRRRA